MSKKENNGNKNLTKEVMLLFVILTFGILTISGVFYFINSAETVFNQKRNETVLLCETAAKKLNDNKNLAFLVDYWSRNKDSLDIQYDDDAAMDEKHNEFDEEAAKEGFALFGSEFNEVDIENCSEKIQKLYAEYEYMYYSNYFGSLKDLYTLRYLYTIKVLEDDVSIEYILCAAKEDEGRESVGGDIYELGHVDVLDTNQYADMYETYRSGQSSTKLSRIGSLFGGDTAYHVYVPIIDDDRVVCMVCISVGSKQILREMFKNFVQVELFMVVLIMMCLTGLYYLIRKVLIRPIIQMSDATAAFGKTHNAKNFADELRCIKSKNEIGMLSQNLSRMGEDLINYVDEVKEMTSSKERVKTELDMAARIQAAALNCDFDSLPQEWNVKVHAMMTPARSVGGDFYSFFKIDDDTLALLIADVSGKGIPAALFMMISKVYIEGECLNSKDPAQVLTAVNNRLSSNNEADMFVTVYLAFINVKTGHIVACNAGHEYPIIISKDGSAQLLRDTHGMMIGCMNGIKYRNYEMDLSSGDILFLYTDGVSEANDKDGNQFGTERLKASLESHTLNTPKDAIMTVNGDIETFVGTAQQFDDITMLAFKID